MSRAALSGLGEAERDALALALHHSSPAELLGRAAEALARSGTYPPGYELAWLADNADVLGAWLTTQAGGPVGVESTRTGRWRLDAQDAAGFLDSLAAGSVDALVTDPPAGIGFLGHAWDGPRGGMGPWVVWLAAILAKGKRVLRPGAHALVWALPKRSHWTALALEIAGYEIRDVITHIQGQGMPKHASLLKPASEHWILAKPPGPVQVLQGEACRTGGGRYPANLILSHSPGCVAAGEELVRSTGAAPARRRGLGYGSTSLGTTGPRKAFGAGGQELVTARRCAPGCPVEELAAQSGTTKSASLRLQRRGGTFDHGGTGGLSKEFYGDEGTAVRFFHDLPPDPAPFLYCPKDRAGRRHNPHPTAKPPQLMRLLCRLITPSGGTVLDCFSGSGTTGEAALLEGMRFVGCDAEQAYVRFARARLAQVERPRVRTRKDGRR